MVGGEEALNESETNRWTKQDLPTPASYKNIQNVDRLVYHNNCLRQYLEKVSLSWRKKCGYHKSLYVFENLYCPYPKKTELYFSNAASGSVVRSMHFPSWSPTVFPLCQQQRIFIFIRLTLEKFSFQNLQILCKEQAITSRGSGNDSQHCCIVGFVWDFQYGGKTREGGKSKTQKFQSQFSSF